MIQSNKSTYVMIVKLNKLDNTSKELTITPFFNPLITHKKITFIF